MPTPIASGSFLVQPGIGLMVWTLVVFGITMYLLSKLAFPRIAEAQRERVKVETEEDRQRRLEETRRQIEQATQQALGEIRREVAELSLLAAEKITRKTLTGPDQQRLIDEALAEIDFSQLEASRS